MSNAKSELVAQPYTNSLGQVINPGDSVVYVTKGQSYISVSKGIFRGVRKVANNVVGTSVLTKRTSSRVEYTNGLGGKYKETIFDYKTRTYVPTGRTYDVYHDEKNFVTTLQRNRLFPFTEATDLLIKASF